MNYYANAARALLVGLALAGLAACAGPSAVVKQTTYTASATYDGALKAFIAYKRACANRSIPASCRGVVVRGQAIIRKAEVARKVANSAALQIAVDELVALIPSGQ